LSGQFYAEVDFADGSYLGELTPVPEPSSAKLIFCGVGCFALLHRLKSRNHLIKICSPNYGKR
jgi:hypothetical protein